MIHLSAREYWLICGVLGLFALGAAIQACRRPQLEYVPGKVDSGWRTLEEEEITSDQP